MKTLIDKTRKAGDTLGGIIEVRVEGVPFGLGTHAQWDQKLDGRLAQAVMAVQAIKGVEIGLGFEAARRLGSQVHDPIGYDAAQADTRTLGFTRPTNHAGGLEAGMTNAQPIVLRAAMKPISTLAHPLESVDLRTKQPQLAAYERSDVLAVAAASCVIENVVAFEIARALVEKFGGDSLKEMQARWRLFHEIARQQGNPQSPINPNPIPNPTPHAPLARQNAPPDLHGRVRAVVRRAHGRGGGVVRRASSARQCGCGGDAIEPGVGPAGIAGRRAAPAARGRAV